MAGIVVLSFGFGDGNTHTQGEKQGSPIRHRRNTTTIALELYHSNNNKKYYLLGI